MPFQIVESASAEVGSEHEVYINLPGNHVEMVKFSSPTDYRYTQIKDPLYGIFRRLERRSAEAANANGMRSALIVSAD
jgi:hypothetical protein